MTTDRRDLILNRLFAVLQTTPGIQDDPYRTGQKCVYRDRDQLPAELRPGILLLDGDEHTDPVERPKAGGRTARAANLVTIQPEIFLVLPNSKPGNSGYGPLLNSFRLSILGLVLNDATLKSLVSEGSGGSLWYNGMGTDLARGRTMAGEMLISLWLTYPLIPSELT